MEKSKQSPKRNKIMSAREDLRLISILHLKCTGEWHSNYWSDIGDGDWHILSSYQHNEAIGLLLWLSQIISQQQGVSIIAG